MAELRILPTGTIIDPDGKIIARVVYADAELAEAMRAAAECVWQNRSRPAESDSDPASADDRKAD